MSDGSHDLMAWAYPIGAQRPPTTSDGMYVGAADSTMGDIECDIVRTFSLEFEFFDSEVLVVLGVWISSATNPFM